MSSQTIATSAQSYHCNLGWAVVPIQKNSKIPPKGFRLRRFFTNSPTESNVRSWFPSDYDGNLGVILGDVSDGLACRDFDDRDSYQRWAAAYPRLADRLPTETTPRGHHVYFTADEGEVRDISPSGRSIIRFDDGELRGGDGYCVLSPSAGYDWRIPPTSVPHVADLILAGFVPANGHQQGQQRNKNHRCVTQDVTQEYDLCDTDLLTFAETVQIAIDTSQPTRPGKRNQMVFELARALRSIPELHGAGQSILKPIVQR